MENHSFCAGISGYAGNCVMLGISFVMRRNQQEAIRVERENNAKLETVNTKLRQAKQAAEDAFQVPQKYS